MVQAPPHQGRKLRCMLRSRPGLLAGLLVAAVVLLVSGGLFAIQYGQAAADCAELPRPDTCAAAWPPQAALDAVFASVAGLLAAIVMAITVGVNARRSPAPNIALVLQLEEEERYLQEQNARRAQYNEWMGMARARDKELKERAAEAAQAAMAAALAGRAGAWEEETPVPEPTIDDRRRQALAEHLQQLAKNKPETVAEVIKSWINQPQR